MKYKELSDFNKVTFVVFWRMKLKDFSDHRYDDSFKISYNKLGNEEYYVHKLIAPKE